MSLSQALVQVPQTAPDRLELRPIYTMLTVLPQPFLTFEENPSYLIASSLPPAHEALRLPLIRIHVHPEPVKVAYKYVRETIPKILFPDADALSKATQSTDGGLKKVSTKLQYDAILHIGVAGGRNYYTLETLAHRDYYTKKDVDGETMEGDTLWREEYKAPATLHTSYDTEDVWRRWKAGLTVSMDSKPLCAREHDAQCVTGRRLATIR